MANLDNGKGPKDILTAGSIERIARGTAAYARRYPECSETMMTASMSPAVIDAASIFACLVLQPRTSPVAHRVSQCMAKVITAALMTVL
jgi:hypothetical protein